MLCRLTLVEGRSVSGLVVFEKTCQVKASSTRHAEMQLMAVFLPLAAADHAEGDA